MWYTLRKGIMCLCKCKMCDKCCDSCCHKDRCDVNSVQMSCRSSSSEKSANKSSISFFNIRRPNEKRKRRNTTRGVKNDVRRDSASALPNVDNVLRNERASVSSAEEGKSKVSTKDSKMTETRRQSNRYNPNLGKKNSSSSSFSSSSTLVPNYAFVQELNSKICHRNNSNCTPEAALKIVDERSKNRKIKSEKLKVSSGTTKKSRRHKSDSGLKQNSFSISNQRSTKILSVDEDYRKCHPENASLKQNNIELFAALNKNKNVHSSTIIWEKVKSIFGNSKKPTRHNSEPTLTQKSLNIIRRTQSFKDNTRCPQNDLAVRKVVSLPVNGDTQNQKDTSETTRCQNIDTIFANTLPTLREPTNDEPITSKSGSDNDDNQEIYDSINDEYENFKTKNDGDFETYILDDNEENYIVEAFNDVGNELVITFLEICRKNVDANTYNNEKIIEDNSIIVFHKEENNDSYQEILNSSDNIPEHNITKHDKETNVVGMDLSPVEPHAKLLQELFRKIRINSQEEDTKEPRQEDSHSGTEKEFGLGTDIVNTIEGLDLPRRHNSSIIHKKRIADMKELSKISSGYESEDVEYLPENVCEEDFVPMRRSTICDESGNVRIEKFCSMLNSDISELSRASSSLSRKESAKTKIDYIVEELIQTEAKYVSDLEKVIRDYKPYVDNLSLIYKHLAGKSSYIFGNILSIYENAKQFHKSLEECDHSIIDIGRTFLKFKSMFELYPLYSKNRPKADRYLKEFQPYLVVKQAQFRDRLGLGSYLLTPVQRLGKYILLLENILKYPPIKDTETEVVIKQALNLVKTEMRKGNDCLAIDSIKKCPFNLSSLGAFLRREKFVLLKPRKLEVMVFLFEEIVVFTTINMDVSETFVYYESIYLADLSIACFENHPTIFHLNDFPRNKLCADKKYTFVLEATNHKIKEQWTNEIEKLLWKQLEKCKSEILKLVKRDDKPVSRHFIKARDNGKQKTMSSKRLGKSKRSSRFYTTM